jgi:hypothetical protein
MTELEWKLCKELCQTRRWLAEAHLTMAAARVQAAIADDAALGEAWVDPTPPGPNPMPKLVLPPGTVGEAQANQTIDYGKIPPKLAAKKAVPVSFERFREQQLIDDAKPGDPANG